MYEACKGEEALEVPFERGDPFLCSWDIMDAVMEWNHAMESAGTQAMCL